MIQPFSDGGLDDSFRSDGPRVVCDRPVVADDGGGVARVDDRPARQIPRDLHEDARDVARALAKTEAFE